MDGEKFYDGHTRMVFKYKSNDVEALKILTPKQMLQRLPIALAQIEARNTSKKLLNEIRHISQIYFFHQAKKITEKVNDNIMGSIKL